MHQLNVAAIKLLRPLVRIATAVLTPRQPPAPRPNASTTFPSPASPPTSSPASHGTAASRQLKADIYLPSLPPRGTHHGDPLEEVRLPLVLNYHASGFCFREHGGDARFCAWLATAIPAVVVDVDYSHAPELPFPAAVEDVDASIAWARRVASLEPLSRSEAGIHLPNHTDADNAEVKAAAQCAWDPTRIALTGFSAGGNLALVGSTHDASAVAAVVAFYPSTNLSESPWHKPQLRPSSDQAGGALPPRLRHMLYSCYLPVHVAPDRTHPDISPLYAPPHKFPKSVTIVTCEMDALDREAKQLVQRLQESAKAPKAAEGEDLDQKGFRGDVVLWTAEKQGHNWDKMTRQNSYQAGLKDEAYSLAADRIRKAFASVPTAKIEA